MSGFSIADLHAKIIRRLGGRCVRTDTGLIAYNGERHEHCGTCQVMCGREGLGFSGGLEVVRTYGSEAIALRWACPVCGVVVTQETTALGSLIDAEAVKQDPLCHRCRA
jgi:hypothetical protein